MCGVLVEHDWHGSKCRQCGKDICSFYSNGRCTIVAGQINNCPGIPHSGYENCIVFKYNATGDTRVLYKNNQKNTSEKTDYNALSDKLAHLGEPLSLDGNEYKEYESEIGKMEEQLLSGGTDALTNIVDYLLGCGQGRQSQYWWNNAKRLVRLIRRFPDTDHETPLKRLIYHQSNIWEYQTQVKNVAQEELSELSSSGKP